MGLILTAKYAKNYPQRVQSLLIWIKYFLKSTALIPNSSFPCPLSPLFLIPVRTRVSVLRRQVLQKALQFLCRYPGIEGNQGPLPMQHFVRLPDSRI